MRKLFGRDRMTAQFAVAIVGLLAVGAVVFGVGEAGAKYHIADVGAWLGAGRKGLVVHANGLAGKVDGKGKIPSNMSGHQIKVVQSGGTVMIVDLQTGVVARVDPTTFDVGPARKLGDAAGLDLITAPGQAYAIDQVKGTVQQIDPATLGAIGGPSQLTAPLGGAAIDGKGTLWVPEGNTGQVVPFQGGHRQNPVAVGRPGDTLTLTVAAGVPVVTDSTQAAATVVGLSGPLMRVTLPSTVRQQPTGVLAPITSDGQLIPLLAPAQGALVVVNAGNGRLSSARIELPRGHRFEAPQSLGPRIYIPDTTAGNLLVYDTGIGRFEPPVGVPDARGKSLEVFVKDGLLWVNNPDGPAAVVVNTTGQPTTIGKYDANVPGGGKHPIPRGHGVRPSVPPVPAPPRPTAPATTPPPWAAPAAPTNINATSGAGQITVSFQPSAGGTPTGYVVKDAGGAAVTASPPRIAANSGLTTFTVTGGSCSQEYRFVVAVQYLDRNRRPAELNSAASVPARPCVTPGAPTGFTATAVNHGAQLGWRAASGGGGTPIYVVSGSGVSGTTSGTSTTASGLTNGQTYSYQLTARTGAGDSAAVTASADLDPAQHAQTYPGWHNGPTNTWLHSNTSGTTASRTVKWPVDYSSPTTVICQTTGANMQDNPGTGQWSTIWDQVRYNGATQWVSDLYIHTPNSASSSYSSTVWNCT